MNDQNIPVGTSSAPADLVGGTAPPKPRGSAPKKLLWIGGLSLLSVMVIGKAVSDYSNDTLSDVSHQAKREPGSAISKESVKAEFDAGKALATPKKEMTDEQVRAAIAQPASLSAAEAAAAARGEPPGSPPLASRSSAPSVGDSLSTTSVEKNTSTPEGLFRTSRGAPGQAPIASAGPSANNPFRSGGTAADAAKNNQVSKEEEELFSRRNSPLMVGGATGSSAGSSNTDATQAQLEKLLRNQSGGAPAKGADSMADLLQKYQQIAGTGSGAASSAQNDWVKQANSPPPSTIFSQPAPQGIVVLPGSVINAVTRTTIRSDLPGDVIGMVTEDLYDSTNGRNVVIPKGSRLSGIANSDLKPGQERALTAFKQVFFPDGRSFDLQGATGSDAEGASGMYDDVERHYFRRYGAGLLLASLAYVADRLNPKNQVVVVGNSTGQQQQTLSTFAGQTMLETTKSYINQQGNIPDTLIIKAGQPFTIIVKQPLSLIPTNSRIQ